MSNHIKIELADNSIIIKTTVSGINLLIGQDPNWEFYINQTIKMDVKLIAIKIILFCCCGNNKMQYVLTVKKNSTNHEMFDMLNFCNLESIGISPKGKHNNDLHEKTTNQIKLMNGRYFVKLQWKNIRNYLINNRGIAKKRLYSLTSKLIRETTAKFES